MLQSSGELLKQRGPNKTIRWHVHQPPEANRRLALHRGCIFVALVFCLCPAPRAKLSLRFAFPGGNCADVGWNGGDGERPTLPGLAAPSPVSLGPSKPTVF